MKTTLRRNIGQKLAVELVDQIAQNVGQMIKIYSEGDDPEFFWDETHTIGNWQPDAMSGDNTICWPAADILQLDCQSGSGNHQMVINIHSGDIIVSTDGYRNSYPGNGMDFVKAIYPLREDGSGWIDTDVDPFNPWAEINNIKDWEVLDVSTSEPTWATVTGWLNGKIGSGPSNQYECNQRIAETKIAELERKFDAIDKQLPPKIRWESEIGFFIIDDYGRETPWRPKFTGLEYRLAAANGVRL